MDEHDMNMRELDIRYEKALAENIFLKNKFKEQQQQKRKNLLLRSSRGAPSEATKKWKALEKTKQDFTQSHRQLRDTAADWLKSLDDPGASAGIYDTETSDTLNALRSEMIRVGNLPKTLDLNSSLGSLESAPMWLPSTSATGSMPGAFVGHHGTSRLGATGSEAGLRAETRAGKRLAASGERERLIDLIDQFKPIEL